MRKAQTRKDLKKSRYRVLPVREEMRKNLIRKLKAGEILFADIIGYEQTVIPQLENAILAGHDMIFLGERGQAKSRLIRNLADLLDEEIPIVKGCEVNDNPFAPICKSCCEKVSELGDALEIEWIPRERRYAEKLATPDVTIADLIGEVDPIKVAEGKYLSDEEVIHFGLIPRVNRGIFSINELPDLAEKVQVGLFNIMEESDIQIKGFMVRLKLDVLIVASANPEDYTNRGRIITPLKDRYSSQIRTHYPVSPTIEARIVEQERRRFEENGYSVIMPPFMQEILTQVTFLARQSPEVNQHSGVSVRMSISNTECLLSNAEKRSIRLGESEVVPRITDLASIVSSTAGKLELESFSHDGHEDKLIRHLISEAVKQTFDRHFDVRSLSETVSAFQNGATVVVSDSLPSEEYVHQFADMKELAAQAEAFCPDCSPAMFASVAEFILEGLYLHHRIHKESLGTKSRYKG
ncbi:MAG: magnesium chelatase [Candidatus Abyssobacteria bacterium SURF_17]|uniref:Magnesium chelatase n=1 Tax=Candidatus Abyssobacteria bacterium SURF_17 TaxID=2093361 RepID=A0A419EVE3_9BACT|nr:MAG: magnesium chelatase [Candidatus Abyssubacteria bacterium SURF_17]